MQKHLELTRQRAQNFATQLSRLFYSKTTPVQLAAFAAPGRITYAEALLGDFEPITIGKKFGPLWSTHWVRVDVQIPIEWKGYEIHLLWDSASEACLWQHGEALQGLTGSFSSWQDEAIRKEFSLTKHAYGGETLEFYIEAACNGLFGLSNESFNPRIGELLQAEIAIFDREAWNLHWDLKVIADMAVHLPANSPRGGQALYTANEMVNTILLDDQSTWLAAREIAARFFSARSGDGQHNLSAIGHAHIDTAWLWPLAETKRKSTRTFASATRYMDDYPEYKFSCSQAQQLDWIRELHPSLYARIREKVHSGQFIPVGGSWVEPDCNIPSGESLVRQFLYGQRFFENEFGTRCQEFWNPDVFGYSGALPQIMKLAGIRYFLTQKLSWNQFNKPASHTFQWEGIDGSRILTHFPPVDTYNSVATVKEVLYNVSNFKDHERANESYLLFGFGDGGGGPTIAMLEQIRRMSDVDGLPRTQIRAPQEFFARCESDLKDPLVVVGELYFELHRGTYTSQARNKKFNRQSEILLRDAEMLSTLALVVSGQAYPGKELEKLWKLVLTNQFHDIIPGSSIGEVYSDSTLDYEYVREQATALCEIGLRAFKHGTSAPDATAKILAFNTLSFPRCEIVELPDDVSGGQVLENGKNLGVVNAPALGYSLQGSINTAETVSVCETKNGFCLENRHLKAEFNDQAGLTSLIYKKTCRESIEPGSTGNTFLLYEDMPNNWDAWDVDVFHLEKKLQCGGAISAKIIESGPLRAAIAFEFAISPASVMRQVVSLDALALQLNFDCDVDWHERHKFLKVEFPLNVRAQLATYEIQFGYVQRPTNFNTSFDLARFEVPAQKWADLSEPGFGVALLNDCKYGYAAFGNVLRLSLLRAPTNPDPEADQGRHQFRYALVPHEGTSQFSEVTEAAYRFNIPLLVDKANGADTQTTFFVLDTPALIVDTIKKAEDSDALILRLYESQGTRGTARLTSSLPVRSAMLVNLLEDEMSLIDWRDGARLEYKPFEIISVRLEMR